MYTHDSRGARWTMMEENGDVHDDDRSGEEEQSSGSSSKSANLAPVTLAGYEEDDGNEVMTLVDQVADGEEDSKGYYETGNLDASATKEEQSPCNGRCCCYCSRGTRTSNRAPAAQRHAQRDSDESQDYDEDDEQGDGEEDTLLLRLNPGNARDSISSSSSSSSRSSTTTAAECYPPRVIRAWLSSSASKTAAKSASSSSSSPLLHLIPGAHEPSSSSSTLLPLYGSSNSLLLLQRPLTLRVRALLLVLAGLLLGVPAFYGIYCALLVHSGVIVRVPLYSNDQIAQAGWSRVPLVNSTSLDGPRRLHIQQQQQRNGTFSNSTSVSRNVTSSPWLGSSSPENYTLASRKTSIERFTFPAEHGRSDQPRSFDVDAAGPPHVLILTPLKDAGSVLPTFFRNLESLRHPRNRTSLGFLLGDEQDDTGEIVAKWCLQRATAINQTPYSDHSVSIDAGGLGESPDLAVVGSHELRSGNSYRRISVLRKDFNQLSPQGEARHRNWIQAQRRKMMAKARTLLVTATLRPDVDYVLWLDSDVRYLPPTLIEDLLKYGRTTEDGRQTGPADIVTPNVVRRKASGKLQSYDLNNWAETPESEIMKAKLPADYVLHEGDRWMPTGRLHLADSWVKPNGSCAWSQDLPPQSESDRFANDYNEIPHQTLPSRSPTSAGHAQRSVANSSDPNDVASLTRRNEDRSELCLTDLYDPSSPAYIGKTIKLDAIGGVATLVKASVHRAGALFPSWVEDHQVETEGFGVMARRVNATIVGLPNYLVFHQ